MDLGRALSGQFSIPFMDALDLSEAKPREVERFIRAQFETNHTEPDYVFLLTINGLSLAQLAPDFFVSIRADFHGPTVRYRREKGGGKGQMIAKAVGLRGGEPIHVLDATAGLGRDAFVLASLGCQVTLLERVPEVRALLADALKRAEAWGRAHDPGLLPILERMQLVEADALECMPQISAPDVVYLDPMFPPRSKSAQVKKEMRVFHDLVGSDPDAADLLPAALDCARRRVVVKRPRLAPALGPEKPSHSLEGKSNRFDVYVCAP